MFSVPKMNCNGFFSSSAGNHFCSFYIICVLLSKEHILIKDANWVYKYHNHYFFLVYQAFGWVLFWFVVITVIVQLIILNYNARVEMPFWFEIYVFGGSFRLILFFSLYSLYFFISFACIEYRKKYIVHTAIGSNERMKPLFVNFFGEIKKITSGKKSIQKKVFIYFSSSSSSTFFSFYTFTQLSFVLVSSCYRAVCFFSLHLHTRKHSFSHVTGHEKSTKLIHTHSPAKNAHVKIVHRSFIDMRVVSANRPKWILEGYRFH